MKIVGGQERLSQNQNIRKMMMNLCIWSCILYLGDNTTPDNVWHQASACWPIRIEQIGTIQGYLDETDMEKVCKTSADVVLCCYVVVVVVVANVVVVGSVVSCR